MKSEITPKCPYIFHNTKMPTPSKKSSVLGVLIDNISMKQTLKTIKGYLESKTRHSVVTANPEIVMRAINDKKYKFNVLKNADLIIPDGFGLIPASYILGSPLKHRITGVDLTYETATLCKRLNKKLFLLGATEEVLKKAAQKLGTKYYSSDISKKKLNNDKAIIEKINKVSPDVILVALGAPYQEQWIQKNLKKLPSVKLAIGVGGSFDYISGKVKRAPKIIRKIGLEWLIRLILQPKRINRIITATIKFPIAVIKWRVSMAIRFRHNALALIYKEIKGKPYFFIGERNPKRVEPSVKKPVYQLPQGGIEDGENPKKAALREMKEELGTDKFEIIKRVAKIHRYRWENSARSPRWSAHGYAGQQQDLFIMKFKGKDSDFNLEKEELVSFKWVSKDELIESIEPIRRNATQSALTSFKKYYGKTNKN